MLRTNLATRPFYNERSVHGAIVVVCLVAAAVTLFNISQVILLSRRHSASMALASSAEQRASELRTNAVKLRDAVSPKQLDSMAGAAREANTIIGQRLFSWTDLLTRLEKTLPDDVRITSLRPQVERDGSVSVQMTVTGRTVEDIDRFMTNLEGTSAFTDVLPREDVQSDDGLLQVTVEGKYVAPR